MSAKDFWMIGVFGHGFHHLRALTFSTIKSWASGPSPTSLPRLMTNSFSGDWCLRRCQLNGSKPKMSRRNTKLSWNPNAPRQRKEQGQGEEL